MSRNDRGISALIIILCVALILGAVMAVYLLLHHPAPPGASAQASRPALSAEQKAYFPLLEFTELHMSAAENFLGDTVTYLDARVTNKGTKPVSLLEVELNFVDTLNQVVLRENARPVTSRGAPLKPGETRSFRVTFEHIPVDWNQAPPTIRPVYLEF